MQAVFNPVTTPKSYQDVKVTVTFITGILLAIIGTLIYRYILPPEHQASISSLFGSEILKFAGFLALCAVVAYFLIFIIDLHSIYDSRLIKWRQDYELYFILPRLVQPLGDRVDKRFFIEAAKNQKDFLEVFYFFVGDHDKDKIRENLKVRFYEVAVRYWVTQYVEIFLLLSEAVVVIYYFVYRSRGLSMERLLVAQFIIIALFIVNRLFKRKVNSQSRENTLKQIEEIHEHFMEKLEGELGQLHQKYNLVLKPY